MHGPNGDVMSTRRYDAKPIKELQLVMMEFPLSFSGMFNGLSAQVRVLFATASSSKLLPKFKNVYMNLAYLNFIQGYLAPDITFIELWFGFQRLVCDNRDIIFLILLHKILFKFSYEFLLLLCAPGCVLHLGQVGTHLVRAIYGLDSSRLVKCHQMWRDRFLQVLPN